MMENSTHTAYRGAGGVQTLIDRGLCPKCQTPSVIEDMGDFGQCTNCGLFMGNNLKAEILETRQIINGGSENFEQQYELI